MGEAFGVGTGEIIDQHSAPGEDRNQIDVIIYRKEFPRICLGGKTFAYFVESVLATIEVKSYLTEAELRNSLRVIRKIKALKASGTRQLDYLYDKPPGIACYVFAFDGPAKIGTAFGHLRSFMTNERVVIEPLPPTLKERLKVECPLSSQICVLGRGSIQYDNTTLTTVEDAARVQHPDFKWTSYEDHSLFWFFAHLTRVLAHYGGTVFHPEAYLQGKNFSCRFCS